MLCGLIGIENSQFPVQQATGYKDFFEESFLNTTYKDFTYTNAWGWENGGSGMISLPSVFPRIGVEGSSVSDIVLNLAVKDYVVYLTGDSAGLEMMNIIDPTNPQSVPLYSTNGSFDVVVEDDYLYLTSYSMDINLISYFSIFNVSDPLNPNLIGSLTRDFNSSFWTVMMNLCIIDSWAYVFDYNLNLGSGADFLSITTLNLTDLTSPSVASTYVLPSTVWDASGEKEFVIAGDYLYFPDEIDGLLLLDISDPTALVLAANYTFGGLAISVFIEQDLAYVLASDKKLHVFDITTPTNASLLASIGLPYTANTLWVENSCIYLPSSGPLPKFQVIDLHNPLNPLVISSSDLYTDRNLGIFRDKNFIYICGMHLEILDAGYYESTALAQSKTNVFSLGSTLFSSVEVNIFSDIPSNTSIDFFLSSDAGSHWEQTSASSGGFVHSFTFKGSELRWRVVLRTMNQSITPSISHISFTCDLRMKAPVLFSLFDGFMTFDNSPTLIWEEIPDAIGYTIQLDRSPTFNSSSFQSMYVTSSSYTVIFEDIPPYYMEELTPGTWYWRVGAHDMDDYLGTFSPPYRLLIDSITHPDDLNLSIGSVGHSITWIPLTSDPNSFHVFRNGIWIAGGPWTGELITVNVDNLPLGLYNYTCTAYASSGDNVSDMVTVTVTEVPNETLTISDPPQNLDAYTDELSVYLDWNPPINNGGSSVTGYRVYRGTSSSEYSLIFITSDTAFIDTLVTEDITYYYMVTAINSVGESFSSNEVTATPLLPTSPTTTTSTSSAPTTSDISESMSDSTTTQAEAGSFSPLYVIIIFLCTITIYERNRKKG